MFATKPQLAGTLLDHAHSRGIRAAFVAGDEVYGGPQLRRRSAAAAWGMCWRSAPITPSPPLGAAHITAARAVRLIPRMPGSGCAPGRGTKGAAPLRLGHAGGDRRR